LAAAEPSIIARMQVQNPEMLADFAGAGNAAGVRLMLDLGFAAAMARVTGTQPRRARTPQCRVLRLACGEHRAQARVLPREDIRPKQYAEIACYLRRHTHA